MSRSELILELAGKYPEYVKNKNQIPEAFTGKSKIKAIILGADPTHIVDNEPREINMVFGLDNPKSPYWRSIQRNIDQLDSISMDNIFVQNVCQNYFSKETSENDKWIEIAERHWIPFLKKELDEMYDPAVPVLITTEFILKVILDKDTDFLKAKSIYEDLISFPPGKNRLGRNVYAFYRHFSYSLKNQAEYRNFLDNILKKP